MARTHEATTAAALAPVYELAARCLAQLCGDAEPSTSMRWAAARKAMTAAARARLCATGTEANGELFAAAPTGASAAQRAALATVPEPQWPTATPPPSFAQLGAMYPELLASAERKRSGAWFTPQALALPTASRVLRPLLLHQPLPLVCDPAVGSGAFLLAALREISAATGADKAHIAAHCLHGMDLDPTAASLACWSLHEACEGNPPPIQTLEAHIRCGDGLLEGDAGGSDAVLGNPPWDTWQDERRERHAADSAQQRSAAVPQLRDHFAHQGRGKLYTYRLFVERAYQLLRPSGRLGLIVPASLWFDRDAAPLRELLLERCSWEWLFAFVNRASLFAIDRRYRFGVIVARKGGRTDAVRVAFGADTAAAWAEAEPRHHRYLRTDLAALSPHAKTFVEIGSERDLALLRHLNAHGRPLLGEHGLCTWRQGDFNMTSDRDRFVACRAAERSGWRQEPDGTWRHPSEPGERRALWQGAMIGTLHPQMGAYDSGSGRGVRWRRAAPSGKTEPQYLVESNAAAAMGPRIGLRALSNATNERSAIACLLADEPCGNSLGVLTARPDSRTPWRDCAFAAGVLASLTYDWALRLRLSGTNLNRFLLEDTVLPACDLATQVAIAQRTLRLCAILPWHASSWRASQREGWLPADWSFATHAATADAERRRIHAELEAYVAMAFGLTADDFAWILRDCAHPAASLRKSTLTRGLDQRGFWRLDRELPPEERLPARALQCFAARGADSNAAETPQPATIELR